MNVNFQKIFQSIHSIFSLHHTPQEYFVCFAPVEARVYFKNKSLDLLSGQTGSNGSYGPYDEWGVEKLHEELKSLTLQKYFEQPVVYHFFYEWTYSLHQIPESAKFADDTVLAIKIRYQSLTYLDQLPHASTHGVANGLALFEKSQSGSEKYSQDFNKIRQNLLNGQCYQVNYTSPYHYRYEGEFTPLDFYQQIWRYKNRRGVLAHATYMPSLQKIFLSNTPECLFELSTGLTKKKKTLTARPIKGTIACQNSKEMPGQWKKLKESVKNHAELTMIVDLMKNDLAKIDRPNSVAAKTKKKIRVPGLLHQYQEVKVSLSDHISYFDVFKAIFPGGSITGAPKMMAVNLIAQYESAERGLYCGSTLFLYQHKSMASLNIRSATVDLAQRELTLGAGGGITLLSNMEEEFLEMNQKAQSFAELFQLMS